MESKSIFKSKTFWANLIPSIIGVLVIIDPEMLTLLGVAPESQVKVLEAVGVFMGLANMALRILTKSAVSVPGVKVDGGE